MDYKSAIDSQWHNCDYEIKEQDRYLPIANVGRVMKKALPPHAKLSRESKECVQECVSEFISFVTSESADRCRVEKRKTLNGEDILWALMTLGFENYAEALKIYLAKYREYEQAEAEKKPPKRSKVKSKTYPEGHPEEYYTYSESEGSENSKYSRQTPEQEEYSENWEVGQGIDGEFLDDL